MNTRKTRTKSPNNKYRSKFEGRVADQLTKRKAKFEYESIKVPYTMPESKHVYKPDFILKNGIYLECKGRLDAETRKKMALVKLQNPELDIRFVFMVNQPIRKGSNTMYSDWCDKNNYKYCFKEIPLEWLK